MTPHLADTPVLETDRLSLRAFGPQDVEPGTAHLMSDRARFMGGPYSSHDAWVHCCSLIGHWTVRGFGLFVFCLKGSEEVIGDAALLQFRDWPEPEIGWGIWDAQFEGRGLATEAAGAVRDFAFAALGLRSAVSFVDPDNSRSIAVAKRLGCTLDTETPLPDLPDWDGTLVFRHPTKGVA